MNISKYLKISFNKKLPIILGVILAIFVAVFLIGAINTSLTGGSAIKVVSAQSVFQSSENPQFVFVYKKQTNIFNRFFSSVIGLFTSENNEISATVKITDSEGKEVDGLNPQIKQDSNGKYSVGLDHSKFQQELKPGKYEIDLEIKDGDKTYTQKQDFRWGVLAINTNKSIYLSAEARAQEGLPQEEAYIQIAALKDNGKTICDANLKLEVKNPESKISIFATEDKTIESRENCIVDSVTEIPDYFVHYRTSAPGRYEAKLINLENGYETIDYFEVSSSVDFDVERIGPTRINPKADYAMKIKITANRDFEGKIIETVPMLFAVTELNNAVQVPNDDNYTKTIIWDASIKKGETKELSYSIHFPGISPYFYLIGPLRLIDNRSGQEIFREIRMWQVAADQTLSLYINGISSATTKWANVGTTPYLDAQDQPTNYIWDASRNDTSDTYSFADSGHNLETINSVTLYTYCQSIATSDFTANVSGTSVDVLPESSWNWKISDVSSILTSWSAIDNATVIFQHANTSNRSDIDAAYLYVDYTSTTYTISGTCYLANQTSICADDMTVKAAVNGTLDTAFGTTSGGSWSITLASTTPVAGNSVTIFISGASDANEAAAVTKWVSGSTLTGVVLYQMHLNIGHANGNQTISNTDISAYDNSIAAGDEDVFFEASATSLEVCRASGCESAELYIASGNTYQPNTGGSSFVETHDIEIDGTFDMSGSGNYASISGSWNNDSVFTPADYYIYFIASDSTEIVSASNDSTNSFYSLKFGDSATSSRAGHWDSAGNIGTLDINQDFDINGGTVHMNNADNVMLGGSLYIGGYGIYAKSSGNFTFNGPGNIWQDGSVNDLGSVIIDGGGTISLNSSVKATSLNITSGDTLDANGSNTLTLTGTGASVFTNSGTFTSSTGTVAYEGNAATTIAALNGTNLYYNLTVGLASDNNTILFSAGGEIEASGSVTLIAGSSGVHTFDMSTYNLSVGGGAASTGGIAVPARTVFTQTAGTTKVYSSSGSATLGGAGTTKFYDFQIGNTSDGATYTFNLGGDVGASNSFTLAAGTHTLGFSSYELGVWENFTMGAGTSLSAQTGTLNLGDTNSTTLTCSTNCEPYNLTINKTSGTDANDNVTLATSLIVRNTLNITDGELIQGTNNVRIEGGTAVSVGASGEWNNVSTGDLVLGGAFSNAGSVSFSSNDSECTGGGTTDDISITTTDGALKTWTNTGAGTTNLYNITADYQADSAIHCTSCTNSGSTSTWTFDACPASDPVVSLAHFRWRNDNNDEINASWKQNEDIDHTNQEKLENIRLRFSIKNTGAPATNYQFELQSAALGGYSNCGSVPSASYSVVPTTSGAGCGSSVACMTTSGNFTNGDATTGQLTSEGTFTAGKMVQDPSNITGAISISQNYITEVEYNFQLTENSANSTAYCFRITNNGVPLNSYSNVPKITVVSDSGQSVIKLQGLMRLLNGIRFK